MTDETRDAVARVRESLKGKARKATTGYVENDAGERIAATTVPWTQNLAGDVQELTRAVPVEKMTPEAKQLWRGTKDLPPDRPVVNHAADLWHLLGLLGEQPDDEPKPEAAPAEGDDAKAARKARRAAPEPPPGG